MQRNRFRLTLTAAALAAVCLHASAQTAQFNIPAQPLADALARFAQQSGVQLVFSPALGTGKTSQPVHGMHDAEAALRQLLRGSGLEARHDGATWTLVAVAAHADRVLGEVKVVAQTERGATTEGTGSYAARGASLFKGVQSLKDIPQSVTVFTRQQMNDQGLNTLNDVLDNTPGIILAKRAQGGSDITSRGFRADNVQYDGVPLARFGPWGNTFAASTVDLDRVEVLRGAQGLLEGAGNPAGSVNLVRKRGLADKQVKVEGRAGSWGTYGTQLDMGGALDEDRKVRGRVVLDYERTGSFIDTLSDRNLNAYAALDVDLTPDTTVGVGLVHSRRKGNIGEHDGVPSYADGRPLEVPRSAYVSADWSRNERTETRLMADLEHRFDAGWKLKMAGTYIKDDFSELNSGPNGLVPLGGGTLPGLGYDYDYRTKSYGVDASLSGKFDALGIAHDVVLGANYGKQARDDGYVQYRNHTTYTLPNINRDVPPLSASAPTRIATADTDTVSKGIYGMLRSKLTERLTSIVGARFSDYEYSYRPVFLISGTAESTSQKENGEFTPYAGLVYALTPQWSAYASYADVFQPQSATDVSGKVLDPILGANYEAGVKGELLDGALNTSLAIFRIDQKNRAVWDGGPLTCGTGGNEQCARAAGKVRSQGVELEAHGNVAKGWQISGGYTYVHNEYLKNDPSPELVGKPFDYDTPEHLLRLWSNWQLPGELSRWQFGTGVHYRSETRGTDGRLDPAQGGYSVWNARMAYQITPKWQAALNIGNVFDKRYDAYIRIVNYRRFEGEPRSFRLTLRGSF